MFFSERHRTTSSASIRRGVFCVAHPTLGERILDQALFRHPWRSDWFPALAYNECRQKGNLTARCRAAIDRLFGRCDFITLERQGHFTRRGGLRGVPAIECTIFRIRFDSGHEHFIRHVDDRHFLPLPDEAPFRQAISQTDLNRVAAE